MEDSGKSCPKCNNKLRLQVENIAVKKRGIIKQGLLAITVIGIGVLLTKNQKVRTIKTWVCDSCGYTKKA